MSAAASHSDWLVVTAVRGEHAHFCCRNRQLRRAFLPITRCTKSWKEATPAKSRR